MFLDSLLRAEIHFVGYRSLLEVADRINVKFHIKKVCPQSEAVGGSGSVGTERVTESK